MKKKRMDQKGGPGRLLTASGYTTNANPAPVTQTSGLLGCKQAWVYKLLWIGNVNKAVIW